MTPDEPVPATPAPVTAQSFADRLANRLQETTKGQPPAPDPVVPAAEVVPPVVPPVETPTETVVEDPIAEIPVAEETPADDGLDLPIDSDDADDSEKEPETKEDRAWGAVKKENSELKKAKTTLESELTQLKARVTELQGGEATDYKARAEELEKELGVVKLESSPAFKKAVTEPLNQITSRLGAIAEEYGIDKNEIFAAVGIADKKARAAAIKDLTGELAPHDVFEVHELGRKADEAFAKQNELVSNHDKVLSELEEEGRRIEQEAAATRATERAAAVDLVIPKIAAKIPALKEALVEISSKIKETDLDAIPAHMKVYNAAAGESLPKLQKQVIQLTKDLQEAIEERDSLRTAAPSIQSESTPAAASDIIPGEKLADRLARKLRVVAPA